MENPSSCSAPFLIPQIEGRSLLDSEGNFMEGMEPKDRSTHEFLLMRELGLGRPNRRTLDQREQYVKFGPNQTLYDIPCQFAFAKRFSPCGKYLICFGKEMHSFMIYSVNYTNNSASNCKFDDFFTLISETPLPFCHQERLCRDFCMFVEGSEKMMILAASSNQRNVPPQDMIGDHRYDRVRTAHTLPPIAALEDYSFWLVRYDTGKVLDQLTFNFDHIILNHHVGASLCGTNFAVTSLQHQIVRIFRIVEGKFVLDKSIGPCFGLDDPKWEPGMLIGIKQRLVAFLYERALVAGNVQAFHQVIHKVINLAIWKAQFIDREHLIIKLGPSEQLVGRLPEGPSQQCLAFWHIATGRIVKFYEDSQLSELYDICRSSNELFRFNSMSSDDETEFRSSCGLNFTPCSSNSLHERYLLDRTVELLANSKNSSINLAKRRLACAIPYNSQVMTNPTSPFFDSDLFRFDDRNISAIDRVRSGSDSTVRFFSRKTRQLCLKMSSNPAVEPTVTASRAKKHQHWIMHPFLPLAISVQLSVFGMTCNVHYYSDNC